MKASLSELQSAKSKFVSACKSADSAAGAYSKAKADGTLKPKDVNKLSQKGKKGEVEEGGVIFVDFAGDLKEGEIDFFFFFFFFFFL